MANSKLAKLIRANRQIAEFLGYTETEITEKGAWGAGTPYRRIIRHYKPHSRPMTAKTIDGLDEESRQYFDWNNLFKLIDQLPDYDLTKPYSLEEEFYRVVKRIREINRLKRKRREEIRAFNVGRG